MVLRKIEKLRKKLHDAIEKEGINSEEVAKISKELDEVINEFNKKQQVFSNDNDMKSAYDKSIVKLKQITIDFGNFPSVQEWDHFAKDNSLLSSESIKYISRLNWHELREKTLYEINKKIF